MVKTPTFGQGHHNGALVDGWRKRQVIHPSVMSPGRDGMSWQMAKVKPVPALPPRGTGGRFRGTCVPGPSGNGA